MCFMYDNRLLCYDNGRVIVMHDGKMEKIISIPTSGWERVCGMSRRLARLLRLGVRIALPLCDDRAIIYIHERLCEVDITQGTVSAGWFCGTGVRPLTLTLVKGIDGFCDGVYFGGYLGNSKKRPVSIYHRDGVDHWEIVYTFPEGVINHVHNIVADHYRQCLWIFTGDFGESAAIWKVTGGFRNVECIACNNQIYRGCVAYALPEGLLYATDAPFAENFICLMDTETNKVRRIFPMHGSCIYGCCWKDNYVFSSTVEGDGRNMSRMEFLFTRKLGMGIKDKYVHMYVGNLTEGFREIYKEKKDGLPLYTFQFGVFKFPYGSNDIK